MMVASKEEDNGGLVGRLFRHLRVSTAVKLSQAELSEIEQLNAEEISARRARRASDHHAKKRSKGNRVIEVKTKKD